MTSQLSRTHRRTLRGTATALTWIATLGGIASVIFGVVMIAHKAEHCGVAPGGDTYCDPAQYPLAPYGIGVILGGILLTTLLAGVARVATAVGQLNDRYRN